jgi:phosphatidate cytidylyltransferase
MSPQAALDSPVFFFYAAIAGGLLLIGGAVLILLKWGFRKKVDHAWQAYLGWLILVPATFVCIFLGRIATIAYLTFMAAAGFTELARAIGLSRDWFMTGVVYLGILASGTIAILCDPVDGNSGYSPLFLTFPVFVILAILAIPIVRNRAEGQLQVVSLAILGFVYFGWLFAHLAMLANAKQAYSYLLFVLVAVELNDVAAYLCGKLLGRHQLRSNISPKKTWEGALGALAFSMLLPWALRFTLPHFEARECLLAGLIIGIGGQLGDLAVSVFKRDLGIKDMGAAIPGHGGFLDRMDSLVYVAPLFFHLTRPFHDLYSTP